MKKTCHFKGCLVPAIVIMVILSLCVAKNNQCSTAKDIENVKDILCDAGLVQVQVDDLSIDMFSRGEGHRVVCGRFVNMKPLRLFGLDKV